MTTLRSALTSNDATHEAVVADFVALTEKTVANHPGYVGMMLRGTLKTARAVDANIITATVRRLLPDLADELDPHWQAFQQPGSGSSFGSYLEQHRDEVIASVLSVADSTVEKISLRPLQKIYHGIRAKGEDFVGSALYDAGSIIHKHAS